MASEQPRARAPLAPVSVYSGSDGVQVQQLGNSRKSSTRRLSVSDAQKGGHGAVASPSKKRRSQSMGGALSEAAAVRAAAAQSAMELSPRKRARRSLVAGRSILKPAALIQQQSYDGQTTGNYTTTLYTQTLAAATMSYSSKNNQNNDDDEAASSSDEGNGDSESAANDNTTRRLSRRVSFAPTAQLREFSKDANEDEDYADESLSNIGASSSPAAPPAKQAASTNIAGVSNALNTPTATSASIASPSPAKAAAHGRRRSSSRGSSTGHRRRSSVANAQSLVDSFNTAPKEGALLSNDAKTSSVDQSLSTIMPNGDESNLLSNESAMDLADISDVTTAFKSHFVFPSTSSQPEAETSFAASAASGNASNIMDMADDDVTSAFALNTHLFGAPSPARSSLQTNSIFTQPSPAHLAPPSPFRPSASNPTSPAASRRRQSHSPSKKVQQQRRESEIKAAWDAEAVRRRSLIYGQDTEVSSSTSTTTTSTSIHVTQDERTHREYHVPLGVEGIDEEAIIQLQRERAKRGSAAFFANRQSTGSSAQVSLFGSTITQTDTSVFSMHHSTDEHDGSMHMTNGEEDTDDQTMDMSIVQDTRRVSNVFAVFTDSRAINDNDLAGPQIEELADDSPSPIKNGSLYPSIEKLQQETSHLQSPTPGDKALAFLDEEDEEYDRTTTTGDDAADQREEQTEGITEVLARQTSIDEQDTEAEGEPSDSSAQAIELESAPASFNPYDFQRHRLSIVPERRDEEDLEEEEDDDRTQDMEETAVYGNVVQPEPVRRLSMAHPRHSLPQASPAESPAQKAKSPGKSNFVSSMKIPSPIVQQQVRRESVSPEIVKSKSPKEQTGTKGRHSLAIPSMPPMAFTSLNEDGPQTESESLFKPVTSGSGTASSMGMSIASAALPSPARPPRSPSMRTGLTPDMRRLNSEDRRRKSTLSSMLASPAPVHGLSRLSGRESLAPNPEPFFEENAPHDGLDGEETEKPKISLDQFLSIADIQFMDGLLSVSQAPGANMKRKNASRPSLERGTSNPYGSVSLSDQISASAAVLPFLEGYRMMVSELRKSLRENSDVMDELEEQIDEETPSLFLDYATADEEDRAMLDTHFKVTRAYYRLQTRNEWYMFRNGVSTSITQMLHGHLEGLTADKAIIDETYRRLTTDHLPLLRDRAKELAEELAKEKARQQELQECDQEHLNELRIAIKEQNSTIEDYKRDVAQTEGTLERLRQKEEELDTQAKDCKDSIEASKKVCDEVRYYTKSELWRLQDELDLVQYLHAWQLVQYDSTRMELSHHNELTITVLFGARGQVEDFELILLDQARDNAIDQNAQNRKMLTTFLFDRLIAHVGLPQIRQYKIKDLLRTVSNIWTRARYIRSTFAILAQQYPVQMSMLTKKSRSSGQPFLRSSARIYAEAVRAEFNVIFELTGDETSEVNPHGNEIEDCVQDIGVSVDVKYGNVDREELLCIVRESVANAGNKALLEACQEAEARYA